MSHDPLSLDSLKYQRAQRHGREVRRLIQSYRDGRPYKIFDQTHPQPGTSSQQVKILRGPPPSISVSLGDALQDLKSALDHAVHELARLNGSEGKVLDDTEFVIAVDESWYQGQRSKRLGAIGPSALAYVDGLQPYLGLDETHPHRAALRAIHQLARIDRHRHIHIAQLLMGQPTVVFVPKEGFSEDEALAAGDLSKVQMNVNLPLLVGINEPSLMGMLIVGPVVDEIERRTGEILVALGGRRP